MDKETVLIVWFIVVLIVEGGFSFWYAWYIYHWPIKPTWISVLYGSSAVLIAELLALGGAFYILGLWDEYKWLLAIPIIALAMMGFPMAYKQQAKFIEMVNRTKEIVGVWSKFTDG